MTAGSAKRKSWPVFVTSNSLSFDREIPGW
jgi:hypothetical protein